MSSYYDYTRSMKMKVDAVFSGGGVRAFAFIGALEALEDKDYKIERVAGSSAGAIVAGLLAAGYKVNELNQIMLNKDSREELIETGKEKTSKFLLCPF